MLFALEGYSTRSTPPQLLNEMCTRLSEFLLMLPLLTMSEFMQLMALWPSSVHDHEVPAATSQCRATQPTPNMPRREREEYQ